MSSPTGVRAQTPDAVAKRLLRASASHSFDPDTDIDWDAPLENGKWFWPPERLSLYATPMWDRMDERQRIELSRQEMASYMSMSIWNELHVLRMFSHYVGTQDPTDSRTHYALTELADETRHMKMMARLLATYNCPVYRYPPLLRRLLPLTPFAFQDLTTFALVLVIEELQDPVQRESMRDERLQSVMRQVCRIHVTEEARHVSFARAELRAAVERASRRRLAVHRELTAISAGLGVSALLDPRVYRAAGLDTAAALRQRRDNPYFRKSMLDSGKKVVDFLTEVGMITPLQHHWWRRANLIA
ncbi:AurF N-oxygenase family protein [Streptomyces candidus]|uniref:Diiron oxygenase n=1 Tax=Streptomyces candidus TaxID=67283 RepID=A0A7X0LQQ0_9ACTN|nr:diiron oxygenase [Streptomyces candidus]MBB6436156.1 hypothetical protein [Streptomyces candidus]GHH43826.1 membrane protein [Streptomyces candidus]